MSAKVVRGAVNGVSLYTVCKLEDSPYCKAMCLVGWTIPPSPSPPSPNPESISLLPISQSFCTFLLPSLTHCTRTDA